MSREKEFKEWLDDYDPKAWEHDLLDSGKREPDQEIVPEPPVNRSKMTREEWGLPVPPDQPDQGGLSTEKLPPPEINQELIEYNGVEDLHPDLLDIANLVYPCKTCGKVAHLGCVPSKFDPDKHFCTSCCP